MNDQTIVFRSAARFYDDDGAICAKLIHEFQGVGVTGSEKIQHNEWLKEKRSRLNL